MDFPALSKLQHAEGAQNNYAAVFNVCSFAHKSLEMQRCSISRTSNISEVARDVRPHMTLLLFWAANSSNMNSAHLSTGRSGRTLKAISHCDEKGWWHILDAQGN